MKRITSTLIASALLIACLILPLNLSAQTLSVRVNSDNSDGWEESNQSIDLGNSKLELKSGKLYTGVRFQNITIPQGATINSASITFTASDDRNNTTNLVISMDDVDNASAFTTGNGNMSARWSAGYTVSWNNVEAWSKNNTHSTPDLTSLVQQLVDRGGWNSGNDMVFLVQWLTGERKAKSHDGSSSEAPLLVIDYTELTEICNNGIDDDGDGDVDCDDSDCNTAGNADAVISQVDVTNPNNALGVADGSQAQLYDNGDQIVLDLTDELPSGEDYTIRWRRDPGTSSTPNITVEESANGSSWSAAAGSPFAFNNTSYFDQIITTSTNTRYLRFTTNNVYNVDLDAVSYNIPCAPACSSGSDIDSDGIYDLCDLDDDNDGITDVDEGLCTGSDVLPNLSTLYTNGTTLLSDGITTVTATVSGVGTSTPNSSATAPNISIGDEDTEFFDATNNFNNYVVFRLQFSRAIEINGTFDLMDVDWTQRGSVFGGLNGTLVPTTMTAINNTTLGTGTLGNLPAGITSAGSFPIVLSNNAGTSSSVDASSTIDNTLTDIYFIWNIATDFGSTSTVQIGFSGNIELCANLDTDGDGTPDYQDLDSDNDGCPDALEGGAGFTDADIASDMLIGGVDANGIPTIAAGGQAVGNSIDATDNTACIDICTVGADDDGDGVSNTCDLDSDNDGILDSNEGCGNTTDISGTIGFGNVVTNATYTLPGADVTYTITTSGSGDIRGYDAGLNGPAIRIHRFNVPGDYSGTVTSTYSNPVSKATFKLTDFDEEEVYTVNVYDENNNLYDLTVPGYATVGSVITQTGNQFSVPNTGNIDGNDPANDNIASVVFNIPGKVSRIDLLFFHVETPGGGNASIRFIQPTFCSVDTDSDAILDYLDTDSDNDGCPDALEGDGGFDFTDIQNDTLTGGVDANGVPVVASGGQQVGTSIDSTQVSAICMTCYDGIVDAGIIGGTDTLCGWVNAPAFTETVPASGTGTLSYQWLSSSIDCNSGFSPIVGAISPTYDPGYVYSDTYYKRVVTNTTLFSTCSDTSNCVSLTVNRIFATALVRHDQCIENEVNEASIDLTVSGGFAALSYDWDIDGTGDFDDTQDLLALDTGRYTVQITDGICTTSTSVYVGDNEHPYSALILTGSQGANPFPSNSYDGGYGHVMPTSGDAFDMSFNHAYIPDGFVLHPDWEGNGTFTYTQNDANVTSNVSHSVHSRVTEFHDWSPGDRASVSGEIYYVYGRGHTSFSSASGALDHDWTITYDFSTLKAGYLPAGTIIGLVDVDGQSLNGEALTFSAVLASGTTDPWLNLLDQRETSPLLPMGTYEAAGQPANSYYWNGPATGNGAVVIETTEDLTSITLNALFGTSGGSYGMKFAAPLVPLGCQLVGGTMAIDDDNNTIQYIPVTGSVLTNDFDLEDDEITFGSYYTTGDEKDLILSGSSLPGLDLDSNFVADAGTITYDDRGDYTFTPNGGFTGEVNLSYFICDATNYCTDADLKIITTPYSIPAEEVNTVVSNDDDNISFGNMISGSIFGNDMDPDLDNFILKKVKITNTVTGASVNYNSINDWLTITGQNKHGKNIGDVGAIVVYEDGTYNFDPAENFVGVIKLKYKICDDRTGADKSCYTAKLVISVLEPAASNGNNRPFAGDDFACTIWNLPTTGNWKNSDSDNDGDIFNLEGNDVNSISLRADTTISYATRKGGSIAFFDDGTFNYAPPTDYYGPDQFRYLICDNNVPAKCDSATIYLIVNPIRKDFGDHPEGYATASHHISLDENGDNMPDAPGTFWLGQLVDGEVESKKSSGADGDDNDDLDDDDGFIMGRGAVMGTSHPVKVIINANQSGIQVHFGLWADWDGDGTYDDFYTDYGISSSPDTVTFNINIPANIPTGVAFIRVRAFNSVPAAGDFTGFFRNGEAEDYKFHVYSGTSLPVELVSFTAEAEGSDAVLQWETASEINNDYFSVQRSEDGYTWVQIAEVEGQGNSTETHNYSLVDENLNAGLYYYRLEQFDFDGTSEFSHIESVEIDTDGQNDRNVSIYPNPARISNDVVVEGLGNDAADIRLYNMEGSVVADLQLTNNRVELSQLNLTNGVYLLEVIRKSSTDSFKLIVHE